EGCSKLLQYAAAAGPAVASPVGTNRSILAALGLPAATSTEDWIGAVLGLLEASPQSLAALGRPGGGGVPRRGRCGQGAPGRSRTRPGGNAGRTRSGGVARRSSGPASRGAHRDAGRRAGS